MQLNFERKGKKNALFAPQVLAENGASNSIAAQLLALAVAMPGVLAPVIAHAESAPEQASVSFKYLDYKDRQTSGPRMHVTSPSVVLIAPVASVWAVEAGVVFDAMSGASPRYHNSLSGASGVGVEDYRKAADLKVTRYFGRAAIGLSGIVSTENDYFSRGVGLDARFSSEDNNTTFAIGVGGASDRINSVNFVAIDEKKSTVEWLAGITQVLSTTQLLQSNITLTRGRGYFSDPYKVLDTRPDRRNSVAWLTRYNHYFGNLGGALNSSYRYYHDSFGVNAHTLELVWRQPLAESWTLSPALRYTTQSAAKFYYDPPFPKGFVEGGFYTADTRLAAFGSFMLGLRIDKSFGDGWSANAKAEFTQQKSGWRLGGSGSPGLETFTSTALIVGLSKSF
jgi:Protein of unknown function (DUF3570)